MTLYTRQLQAAGLTRRVVLTVSRHLLQIGDGLTWCVVLTFSTTNEQTKLLPAGVGDVVPTTPGAWIVRLLLFCILATSTVTSDG